MIFFMVFYYLNWSGKIVIFYLHFTIS
jgi:hypothetical protein